MFLCLIALYVLQANKNCMCVGCIFTVEAGYHQNATILFEDTVIGSKRCRDAFGLNETYNLPNITY